MTLSELATNDITRAALNDTYGLPAHAANAALGIPNCPACSERMNAGVWAVWPDMVRNGWYCVNRECRYQLEQRMRTTRIID